MYSKLKNESDDTISYKTSQLNSTSKSKLISARAGYTNDSFSHLSSNLKNRSSTNQNQENLSNSPQKSKSNPKIDDLRYLEYKIDHSADSIRSISLKFKVDITELKRHNQLRTDADFFAKKILQIPLNKYSSLLDAGDGFDNQIDQSKNSNITELNIRTNSDSLSDSNSNLSTTNQTNRSTPPLLKLTRHLDKNMKQVTEKLEEIKENTLSTSNNLGSMGILTPSAQSKQKIPLLDDIDREQASRIINAGDVQRQEALCSGWKFILFMVIFMLVVLPWVYFEVWREEQEHETVAGEDHNHTGKSMSEGELPFFEAEMNGSPKFQGVT